MDDQSHAISAPEKVRICMHRSVIGISILLAAGVKPSKGQVSATALNIEIQNLVEYQVDTFDFSKAGTNPNVTIGAFSNSGCLGLNGVVALGDIVTVNGHPAKGTYVSRGVGVCMSPTATPRQPIADT